MGSLSEMHRPLTLVIAGAAALLSLSLLAPRAARAQQTAAERLILAPEPATTFRVQAVYPNTGVTCDAKRIKDLRARYRGRLEIVRQSNGSLALIDHLTFDEYLSGLAEMPRSWPIEALKAQVVAARTYAIAQLEHPGTNAKALGFDICSTDQCQVYRGLSVEQGAFGEAWVRAVTETRGSVLRYHGETIHAYYFSTSSGRTRRSFPGGTPQPYLSSVPGQDDDSPLAHWTARFPLADLGPILQSAGDWPGGAVSSVGSSGDKVSVSGSGHSVTLSRSGFMIDLNNEAPCVYPDRYPGKDGNYKLPQTVPSPEFTVATSGAEIALSGRGWGHDVGMSQYGARSLAARGRTHAEILAYYYAGLRPETTSEPGTIRVLVADNAALIRIGVEGSATVTTSTGSALAPGADFEVRGGKSLDVRRGVGPSLTPVLTVALDSSSPITVPQGGSFALTYALSGAARVSLTVRKDGNEVFHTPEFSQVAGPNLFSLSFDPSTSPLPSSSASASPGATVPAIAVAPTPLTASTYDVTLEAYDGLDRVRTTPIALTLVSGGGSPTASPSGGGVPVWAIVAAGGAVLGSAAVLITRRRSRRPLKAS